MSVHTNQQGLRAYRITIQGLLDEEFVTTYCPPETRITCEGDMTRLSNIQADQTTIVGLVRQLHNLGCTILALES